MMRFSLFLLLLLFAGVARSIDGQGTIVSQGIERSFLFHAPGETIEEGMPLVLVFHGLGGNGAFIKQTSGFDAVADANGFIAVYPNATIVGGISQWNAYVDEVAGHAGINDENATDDVIFVDDLIQYFCSTYGIDAQRIYATGHSYGGYMTYRLAVQRPEVFAAVAPVAGGLWGDQQYLTNYYLQDYVPIPVMHIHGDQDQVVPYPDPNNDPNAQIFPLSAFALANCGSTGYVSEPINSEVARLVFCDGSQSDEPRVELIRLIGHGHDWPNVTGFNAAAEIWDFLNGYSIAASSTCEMIGIEENAGWYEFSIHPNPSSGPVVLELPVQVGAHLEVLDRLGRIVHRERIGGSVWHVPHLAPGSYFLVSTTPDGRRYRSRFERF